jgi:uncharacterized protein with HEPN domain
MTSLQKRVSDSTQGIYFENIGTLRNKYFISDLEDYDNVMSKINHLSKNTVKIFCISIMYWNREIKKSLKNGEYQEITEETVKKYRDKIRELNIINNNIEELGEKTEKQKNMLEWKQIIDIRNDMINKNRYSLETCIICMYSYIPPRRLLDYSLMYFIDEDHYDTFVEDNDKNYCIRKDNKLYLKVNRFKMSHKMSSIIFSVHEKLKDIILGYIEKNKIKSGELLLGYKQETSLSTAIRKILEPYAKNNGCNLLRHAYATFINSYPKYLTLRFKKKIALLMGHSLMQNLGYSKQVEDDQEKKIYDEEIKNVEDIIICKKI